MPKLFTNGKTGTHHNHFHYYTMDEDGNGVAHTSYHIDDPKINHFHSIENFSVKESASAVSPAGGQSITGVEPTPTHIHEINDCSIYSSNTMPFAFIDKIVLEGGTPIEQGQNTTAVESDEVATIYCNFKTNMLNEHDSWFSDTNILNMMSVRVFAISNPSTVSNLVSGDLTIRDFAGGPRYANSQTQGTVGDFDVWEQDIENGQLKTYDYALSGGQTGLFQPEKIFKKTLDDGTFVWETPFTIPNLPLDSTINMSFFVVMYLDIQEMAEYLSASDPDMNLDMDDITLSSEDTTFLSVYFENVFSGGSYASKKVQDFRILDKLKMPGFGLFPDDFGSDYVSSLKNLPYSPPNSFGILDDASKNIAKQDKKYFSDVFTTRGYNGYYNSIFFVDFVKIIKNNSKFGHLMENKSAVKALLSTDPTINFPITSLRILRKRVNPTKTFPNKLGGVFEYGDTILNDTEEVLCDIKGKIGTGWTLNFFFESENFSFKEGTISKNLTYDNTGEYAEGVFFKDYEFVDKQAKNFLKGSYQYALEMEIFDGTVPFMKDLLGGIDENIQNLKVLYGLSSVPYSGNTGAYIVEQNKLTETFQKMFKENKLTAPADTLEKSVVSAYDVINLFTKEFGFFEMIVLASFQEIEFSTPDSIKVLIDLLELYQVKLEEEIGREYFNIEYPYAGTAKDAKRASNPYKSKIEVKYAFPTLLDAEERTDEKYFDYLTTESAKKLDLKDLNIPAILGGGKIRKMSLSKFYARMIMENAKYKRDGVVFGVPETVFQFATPSVIRFGETKINQLIGVTNEFESTKLLYDHEKYNDLITKIINHNLHIEYIAEEGPKFGAKFATLKNILSGLSLSDATIDTQGSTGGQTGIPKTFGAGTFVPPPIVSDTGDAAPRYGDTLPPSSEADETGNWIESEEEGTGAPLVGHEFSLLSILLLHYIIKGPKKQTINSTKIYDTNFEKCIWFDEDFLIDKAEGYDAVPCQLYSLYRTYQENDTHSKLVIKNKNNDPMKNFNYFGAFWMNHKNLAEVQYLDGFIGNNLILPKFKKITKQAMQLKLNENSDQDAALLCRLKDFYGMGVEDIGLLKLPARDRVFLLSPPTVTLDKVLELTEPFINPARMLTPEPRGLALAPPRFGPGGINIAKENLKVKRIPESVTTQPVGKVEKGLDESKVGITQVELMGLENQTNKEPPIY